MLDRPPNSSQGWRVGHAQGHLTRHGGWNGRGGREGDAAERLKRLLMNWGPLCAAATSDAEAAGHDGGAWKDLNGLAETRADAPQTRAGSRGREAGRRHITGRRKRRSGGRAAGQERAAEDANAERERCMLRRRTPATALAAYS